MSESTPHVFDLGRRERFLALLAVGRSIEQACAEAGVSRQTVNRWAVRGRVEGASPEHRAFAERLDAIRVEMSAQEPGPEEPVGEAAQVWDAVCAGDPFVAIEPRAMALLTPEQRDHACAVSAEARYAA